VRSVSSTWDMPEGLEAPGRIKGCCVGHRIEIDAPPEVVWDFVSDFDGWDSWNPLYVRTEGSVEPGQKLRFTVNLEGLKPQKGTAEVKVVRPHELLEYTISSMGGLVRIMRFVEVAEVSPTRCAVTNGEIMGGPLGGLVARAVREKVGKGLQAMNEALGAVAERKWTSRPS
jgi:hypothetical protein